MTLAHGTLWPHERIGHHSRECLCAHLSAMLGDDGRAGAHRHGVVSPVRGVGAVRVVTEHAHMAERVPAATAAAAAARAEAMPTRAGARYGMRSMRVVNVMVAWSGSRRNRGHGA